MIPIDTAMHWPELLKHPAGGDHIVQVYQDEAFLAETVTEYLVHALRDGAAALVIATAAHRAAFLRSLERAGAPVRAALQRGQLRLLDADEVLSRILKDGAIDRGMFRQVAGAPLSEMRLQYPSVRAYGEVVDVLWRRGDTQAAIDLEMFWDELAAEQGFSVLCAYQMDNLDPRSFAGLESVCRAHSHLIPHRDYARFNQAVAEASKKVLDQPLAQMLLAVSANHRPSTSMPLAQATLLWLKKNMPRTAERILAEVRATLAPSSAPSPAFSTAPRIPRG